MHVEPITCLRPTPEHVAEFASLPYDVFTEDEARSYVDAHPLSFLAIDRPETGFEAGQDPTAPAVYEHAQRLLRERQLDRTLTRDEKPCFYILQLTTSDGHRQTGLMGAVAVDDYLDGTIKRHELTLPAKVQDRVRHIETLRAQSGPVFLTYRDSMAIDLILDAAKQAQPLYDFTTEDGVRMVVWRIARDVAVEAIGVAFTTVGSAYIADGHHRAAASVEICQKRRAEGRQNDPAEQFLAVLFPASQLRILPYNRVVAGTNGLSKSQLLEALSQAGFQVRASAEGAVEPTAKGSFGMYAFGAWYELTAADAQDQLDVALLQNRVLGPVLGIDDPRTSPGISFVAQKDTQELEALAGHDGLAFTLFPTSVEEVMQTSDEGGVMPPKSTWFDPKLLSGLAIRRIW